MADDEDYSWWGRETWGCLLIGFALWVAIGVLYVLTGTFIQILP